MYSSFGIHMHMWYNVNIDAFFVGLMILIIAQLEVLDVKLRRAADVDEDTENESEVSREPSDKNQIAVNNLNACIKHFDEVGNHQVTRAMHSTYYNYVTTQHLILTSTPPANNPHTKDAVRGRHSQQLLIKSPGSSSGSKTAIYPTYPMQTLVLQMTGRAFFGRVFRMVG
ncbi:unnamed protein product [Chrysodeixis includens]|uniref:Uncharacterized protein n=1 Tax=Chrysodeixis includens TaxID=689277 RepID=A0A9N8KRL4_CHRIL|nr:unnamed protein product [Chrysodeixis includens]